MKSNIVCCVLGLGLMVAMAVFLFLGWQNLKSIQKEVEELRTRVGNLEKMLQPPKEEAPVQAEAYNVPVDNSPVLGNKDAPVHIIVFSNYQCPYCGKADKMLRDLVHDAELKNEVNLVFKHFPFDRHPHARGASRAAMAAGEQGKFWEMSDLIFANQDAMREANFNEEKSFEAWAAKLKLDVNKFKKDLKEKAESYNAAIDKDIKLGTEQAKLEGTPWILVGGWLLEGEISPATIKKMIAEKKLGRKE